MKCPECKGLLMSVPLGKDGDASSSFRCNRCGGFWMRGDVINNLSVVKLGTLPKKAKGPRPGGDVKCPVHGLRMTRYEGDSVPDSIDAKRCIACGWWWFGGDSLFEFKPAQEAKVAYFRYWGSRSAVTGLMLPLTALVVLLAGLTVVLYLVSYQQRIGVPAYEMP